MKPVPIGSRFKAMLSHTLALLLSPPPTLSLMMLSSGMPKQFMELWNYGIISIYHLVIPYIETGIFMLIF